MSLLVERGVVMGDGLMGLARSMVVGMGVVVDMTVGMTMGMTVGMTVGVRHLRIALQQQTTPQDSNNHARDAPQPWIETLRDDVV